MVVGAGSSSVLLRCSLGGKSAVATTWWLVVRDAAAVIGRVVRWENVVDE